MATADRTRNSHGRGSGVCVRGRQIVFTHISSSRYGIRFRGAECYNYYITPPGRRARFDHKWYNVAASTVVTTRTLTPEFLTVLIGLNGFRPFRRNNNRRATRMGRVQSARRRFTDTLCPGNAETSAYRRTRAVGHGF